MDLESLKTVLGDEKFSGLKAYVDDLIGQRDAARNESITGRKTLKANLEKAEAIARKALEKLGVDNAEELDTLPDAKGQADAVRQLGAKLSKAERERDEFKTAAEAATTKHRETLKRAAVSEALGGHKFIARDVVETYIGQRLTWEGDELLFKTDDGKLVPVKDGVAAVAKSRPELLESAGTGGAGVRRSNAGSGGDAKTLTRSEFEALDQAGRSTFSKEGGKVVSD